MSQSLSFSIQSEVQLRFLTPDDIEEVRVLCADWFPIDYPDSWYSNITSNQKFYSLAATYQKKIIGLIVVDIKTRSECNREDSDILAGNFPGSTHVAYILSLGVVSDFRRHGIASLLLDSVLRYLTTNEHKSCKAIYLHVLTTNTEAINFYEHRYFKMHNFLPYYYSINGKPRDGYSYVLYVNGGQPPWNLIDYVKNFGCSIAKFQPCAFPQRLLRNAHSLVRRIIGASSSSPNIHLS